MIELTTEQLWEAIYASRDAEKYWRLRRRSVADTLQPDDEVFVEFTKKLTDARAVTRMLESLAPHDSF